MKKKHRIITRIISLLVVILLLLAVAAFFFGESALKTGVETGATKALDVGVSLDSISLKPFAGQAGIRNLVVDNPPGYQHDNLLALGAADVALDLGSLLSNTVTIDSINLDNTTVTLEQKGLTNNLKEILERVKKASPSEEPTTEQETPGKKLHVNTLDITNTTVNVKLLPVPGRADTLTLKLTPIHLEDLGNDKPMNVADLSRQILLAITGGIAQQGAGILPADLVNGLESQLQAFGQIGQQALQAGQKAIEGAVQSATQSLEQTTEGLQKSGESLKKGLEGLLPGQKPEEE